MVFVLPAGIFTLVQSNLVQTYIAKKLSGYLSGQLKTEVRIDRVEVRFFMNVMLKGVYIEDLHHNVLLRSDKINVKLGDYDFGANFFELKKVNLENTSFNLRKYKGEEKTNLQFIINYFKTEKKKKEEKYPIKLKITDFRLSNSGFSFIDDNKPHNNNDVMDFDDINISKINIEMEDVCILADSVCGTINALSANEKSGFVINRFSAKTIVSKHNIIVNKLLVKTPNSDLDLDLAFVYQDFKSFKEFVTKVQIISEVSPTRLNLIDISHYVKQMHGMNNLIFFSSGVKGTVSNLKLKKFLMKYGSDTYFDADITMNGLPKIKETYINLKIRDLTSSVNDLNKIVIPAPNRSITHLKLPQMLQRLGNIHVKGAFTGFYYNFVSFATFDSDLGSVSTDIIVRNTNKIISYDGKVSTENFYLGELLNSAGLLGKVSLDAKVNGSGLTANDAVFTLVGNIQQLEFKNYSYSGITVNGGFDKKIFNGLINIEDQNLEMKFDGVINLNDTLPDYDFKADVKYANLKKLNLLPKDTVAEMQGKLTIDMQGNNIDNLRGTISVVNAAFRQNKKFIDLESLQLYTEISRTGYRTFKLKSDYVDADINGYFVFSELGNSFKRFILNYIPNFYFALDTNNKTIARQEFDFDIRLNNATPVLDYFVTGLGTAGNTMVKGSFNSITNTSKVDAVSSKLSYNRYNLQSWNLNFNASNGLIDLALNADSLQLSDSSHLVNFGLISRVEHDSINSKLFWDNKKQKNRNSANLNFYNYFLSNSESVMGFKPSDLIIDDVQWALNDQGTIVFDTNMIKFNNLMVYHGLQGLQIQGIISKNPSDTLAVNFNSFDISNIDELTNAKKFDLDGIITGKVSISDLYNAPTYYANLNIKDFGINNDKLGDALIISKWDDEKKGIQINAEIYYVGNIGRSTPVIAKGYYYPGDKPQNFDVDIFVENLRLKALNRYVASFGTIVNGTASGRLYLRGKKKPELTGLLKVMRGALKINYLNTVYAFSFDSVKITKNAFAFKDIVAIDQPDKDKANPDTVLISGIVTHEYFKKLGFDIYVDTKKALCLNTNSTLNQYFYGKAYATGNAHIYGDQKKVSIEVAATTEKGTQLFIPVGGKTSLQASDYITFVQKAQDTLVTDDVGKEIRGLSLDMSYNVTEDAEIQLLFDPRVGDRIRGVGNGNIRITYDDNEMNMFGNYVLTSGDYLFTFQNIINKRFIIDPGSSVKWNGDAYDAEMDIRARYKIRANLAGLGIDTNSRYVPVECIINITNLLSNPQFTFEVDLPSLLEYEKDTYLAAINQNINNNFISLLIINSFVNPNTGIGQATTAGASLLGKSASEVLSNQLSNWLSQISKNVNIGINYRPGDNISEEEVAVALSTQLFNDRLSVSSNLGVSTGQNTGNTKNSNQIVGDVDLELKITKALKLKVYNHTNQYDIFQYTSPYTQGLGIIYRKEFNTYKDLFLKRKKAKSKP